MASVENDTQLNFLIARIDRLTSTHTAQWGSMSVHEMICHLTDQMRVALAEIECVRRDNLVLRTIARWLVIHTPLPVPRGKIKTVPEMQSTSPGDWTVDLQTCKDLMTRISGEPVCGIHPAFGPLTDREWEILVYKHTDHHLRQFGV
jgi:hypothetical protein